MNLPEMRRPAAGNGEPKNRNNNNLRLISRNTNPRQRWRGNPPLKRIEISEELLHHLEALKMEACHGR